MTFGLDVYQSQDNQHRQNERQLGNGLSLTGSAQLCQDIAYGWKGE